MSFPRAASPVDADGLARVALPPQLAVQEARVRRAVSQPAFENFCHARQLGKVSQVRRDRGPRASTVRSPVVGSPLVALNQIIWTVNGWCCEKGLDSRAKVRIQGRLEGFQVNQISGNDISGQLSPERKRPAGVGPGIHDGPNRVPHLLTEYRIALSCEYQRFAHDAHVSGVVLVAEVGQWTRRLGFFDQIAPRRTGCREFHQFRTVHPDPVRNSGLGLAYVRPNQRAVRQDKKDEWSEIQSGLPRRWLTGQ